MRETPSTLLPLCVEVSEEDDDDDARDRDGVPSVETWTLRGRKESSMVLYAGMDELDLEGGDGEGQRR